MKREMKLEDCKKGIDKNVTHIVSTLWISGNETKSDVRFSKLHNVDTMLEADVETKPKQSCTTLLQRSIDVVSTYHRAIHKYGFLNRLIIFILLNEKKIFITD